MKYVWFDLFKALGLEHEALEEIRKQHPRDPYVSLYKAVSEWVRGEKPQPSWSTLAQVLRQDMLEVKLADGIAERHFSIQELVQYTKSKLFPSLFFYFSVVILCITPPSSVYLSVIPQ